ncbi:hypothetical protein [Chryseobacterium sp. SG20098]|uniref:hypothetical protein n=1 Tax=Chryseobacterium sp. SG20098 TaxID=3074145 RepID=UPI002883268B|nr:hypothetical protein [Chryseobacterium sp. SG20098]WNI34666.1 hypothetical protein RHP76_11785 [Chryseobacterium sp. SG20098]
MKERTNIANPTKINSKVSRKIQEDYELRLAIAGDIKMRESALYMAAYRNSKVLENYFFIESFRKHTGWENEEIFEIEISE